MTNEQPARRLSVVNLRHRIEMVAVGAVRDSFPSQQVTVEQTQIGRLLAFIPVAYGQNASMPELIGMVRTARHIYKRSSDVLHGRSSMVNLSVALVDEWAAFVETLEDVAQADRG
jgi:hypothetical protein